jgi:hypothetical protein
MKILRLGAELFVTDKQTNGQLDITTLIVDFRNFANVPKIVVSSREIIPFWILFNPSKYF